MIDRETERQKKNRKKEKKQSCRYADQTGIQKNRQTDLHKYDTWRRYNTREKDYVKICGNFIQIIFVL